MKSVKPNPQSLVLTLVLSAAVLAYAFLLFLPTQRSIASLRDELEKQRQYILQGDQQYVALGPLQQEYEQTLEYISQWREDGTPESELPGFLGRLNRTAAEAGVKVRRMQPDQTHPMATLREHPFRLGVDGSFRQLFTFLRELEGLGHSVWFTRVHIQQREENEPLVECELDLAVFTDNHESSD